MSPETNGNPPSAVKRKKNRDRKQQQMFNENNSNCNYPSATGLNVGNSFGNLSIPETTAYYSVLNYTNGTEPMSLPIYHSHFGGSFANSSTPKQNILLPPGNSCDYTSLPMPTLDLNGDDAERRRYSDPGLHDSDSSTTSLESKTIRKLTHQVNMLKECNRRLSKDVTDIRFELNMLKQQMQQQNLRHFDREYEPGMLADVIREVRDAARVREDALLAKVKYIMEEKQLSMSHFHLVSEKNRSNDRITKLEEQIKNLSVKTDDATPAANATVQDDAAGHSTRNQVIELEREALELRRELQDTRAKKEEADQRVLMLDKKLSHILKRNDINPSDVSENSPDNVSITTTSSSLVHSIPKVTLSGPVTDL